MNEQTVLAEQDETISHVCWRLYGKTTSMVEKVLAANPSLCELPAMLPAGTKIILPASLNQAASQAAAIVPTINLWD